MLIEISWWPVVTGLQAAGNHRFAGCEAETKCQGDVGRLHAQNQKLCVEYLGYSPTMGKTISTFCWRPLSTMLAVPTVDSVEREECRHTPETHE